MREKVANTDNYGNGYDMISGFFQTVYRHPILTAAWVCFGCLVLSSGSVSFFGLFVPVLLISSLGGLTAAFYYLSHKDKSGIKFSIIIAASTVLVDFLFCYWSYIKKSYALPVMNIGLAVAAAVFLCLAVQNKLTTKRLILLIIAAGFIMRLSYILYMPVSIAQHDVYYIGSGSGHSGYIEYLYNYGRLPDFDVRTIDQFYHPPFHHIIAALWMRIQVIAGVSYENAYENIRLLTLFYSTVCMIISCKIFIRIGLKGAGLAAASSVIAFCPIFYIMSGSINNDILSITFMLGAFYNTLCWYKSRTMGRILCIALCIGLGMFTKLSVWMAAPPVAFVFIYVFFSDLKAFKKYTAQFAAFLAVCVPVGLFWSVRNFVRWGVPFTFVQRLGENSFQYVGNISVFQRLFDFSAFQFNNTSPQFGSVDSYSDYNPLVGFFKTAMFDERIKVANFPMINGFDKLLFWSSVILGLTGFAAMVYMLCKKSSIIDVPTKAFVGSFYGIVLIMYYYFCIEFPHVCTQNVRYGIPLIVIGALSLGFLIYELFKSASKVKKAAGGILCAVLGIYVLAGYLVYNTVAASFIIF